MVSIASGKLRLQRRANQRGAAIFVVVMVLTMLTAIGVFAMRAASLTTTASGYDRQNTQNHYVGEYGLLGAVTELSTTRRSAYVDKMAKGVEKCSATKNVSDPGMGVPCYHLFANDVQRTVSDNFTGRPLFEPSNAGAGTRLEPGSLGPAPLDGDFVVEMTDPGPVGTPVAGTDVGGGTAKFRYLQVTLTSIGQVRPAGNPSACVANTAAVAGNETGRAFVVIGPLP